MIHHSQLNGRNYRVKHILCRRTPPPPKLNLPLINFGVINFLWISARPPSRGQWYHGLIKLENTLLKILQGGLLSLDLFNIVIEKLPLSLHDYYGVRQRNRDLQASGIPRCQW